MGRDGGPESSIHTQAVCQVAFENDIVTALQMIQPERVLLLSSRPS